MKTLGISLINGKGKDSYIEIGASKEQYMKQGTGHWLIDIEGIPRKYRNPNYITENGNY